VTALSLGTGFILIALAWREINQIKKDIDDLMSVVRVFRYRALEEERDKVAREKKE